MNRIFPYPGSIQSDEAEKAGKPLVLPQPTGMPPRLGNPQYGQVPLANSLQDEQAIDPRFRVDYFAGKARPAGEEIPDRIEKYKTNLVKIYPAEFKEDYGRSREAQATNGADVFRLQTLTIAENLCVNTRVIPSWESAAGQQIDPWTNIVDASLPIDLANQIEVLAKLSYGHDGANSDVLFNIPCGQPARANVIASWAKLIGYISARYTNFIQIDAGPPVINGFLSIDDNTRNMIFNMQPNFGLQFLSGLNAFIAQVESWGGKGTIAQTSGTADRSSRPQRRFFGFIPANTAKGTIFRCPVAESGVAVTLVCDASNANLDPGANVAFAGNPLQFHQLLRAGPVGVGGNRRILNYAGNITFPLRADCVAIEVVCPAVTVNRTVPFEVVFDLGF